MDLQGYLFGSQQSQKLANLVWLEGWQGSVRELSTLSGLSYATTYEALQRMEQFGLVKSSLVGRKRVFISSLDTAKSKVLKKLLCGETDKGRNASYRSLTQLGAPLVDEKPEDIAKTLEELLCLKIRDSKDNATLLRVLPLVLLKTQDVLNPDLLLAYSRKLNLNREVGFLLELAFYFSNKTRFKKWSKQFKDRRWQKSSFYFRRDQDAGPFKQALIEDRTPALAKKWHLKMNMNLESEENFLRKYFNLDGK